MSLSAAPGWWAAASVKENYFNSKFPGNGSELFFCFINRPVSHQVTAVLCTIRKSKHDGLGIISSFQMRTVFFIFKQSSKRISGIFQIFYHFYKRYYIHSHFLFFPATHNKQ